MFGHLKTLTAALVTMLIGATFVESAEITIEPGDEQVESIDQPSGDGDSSNIMGDVI